METRRYFLKAPVQQVFKTLTFFKKVIRGREYKAIYMNIENKDQA